MDELVTVDVRVRRLSGWSLESGGTKTVGLQPTEDLGPDNVDRFEVVLECGTFSDGVYCE